MEMKKFTNFSFYFPTEIVFGKQVENQTAGLVKKYGGTKVMIVMDGGGFIKKSGLFDKITDNLRQAGLPFVELEGVQPNPRLSLVYEGIRKLKAENADFVLAIGGGSTIDTAKAIALGMEYDGDVWDFYAKKAVPQKIGPVGVISTIAGSGSETSSGTVILDDVKSQIKTGVMKDFVRPRFAIMNPELTYTLPAFQTASGAADVLAHAFDTYFTDEASYLGDHFCTSVMRTAVKYGPIALEKPDDYEARAELMLAASFAQNDTCRIGRARSPMTGGGHNLERMSGLFDTTHGAGLAVMMPAFLQSLVDHDPDSHGRIAEFGVEVFDVCGEGKTRAQVAQEGVDRFRAWLKEMKMPSTLHELLRREVTDEDIERLVNTAWFTPGGKMRAFGTSSREDVRNMYLSVR